MFFVTPTREDCYTAPSTSPDILRELNSTQIYFLQGFTTEDTIMALKFIPENETLSVLDASSDFLAIHQSTFKIFAIDFEIKKLLRKCASNLKIITPCVMESYEKRFENSYRSLVNKYSNLTQTTFSGLEYLQNETGCLQPCFRFEYKPRVYIYYDLKTVIDSSRQIVDKIGVENSSILVLNHLRREKIPKHEEVPRYTAITFLSDVGGILGIFLGFSIWSIQGCCIQPIMEFITNKLYKD